MQTRTRCPPLWSTFLSATGILPHRGMRPFIPGSPGTAMPLFAWNSEGPAIPPVSPLDEYVKQEQDDGLAALEWIAKQPWCSGATGMIGISWGGFSSLQIAARRPPSLKAIITVDSTDDRFNDDIHYMGGCLLYANLSWGTQLFTYMMRPPDPALSGDTWRQKWLERLEHAPFVLDDWTRHQSNDAYWQHGSVGQRFEEIECAVYAVCGWADSYSNATMRMAEGLRCPTRIPCRPVGAYLSSHCRSWPENRLPSGCNALVGPVAQRRGQWH